MALYVPRSTMICTYLPTMQHTQQPIPNTPLSPTLFLPPPRIVRAASWVVWVTPPRRLGTAGVQDGRRVGAGAASA